MIRRHSLKLTAAALLITAACGNAEEKAAAEQRAVRQSMAAAETTASQAAVLPRTGLWSEAHVMDRLLRAGVAPRANTEPSVKAEWMGNAPIAILAGGGEVYVWIYRDSTARKAVTDLLDPNTATPKGRTQPFPPPMTFVTNNNLAAVIIGGTITNQDRISLALQAGLPAGQ